VNGTDGKKTIGGDTTTATSLTIAEAAANVLGLELFEYLTKQH
jgi:enolase